MNEVAAGARSFHFLASLFMCVVRACVLVCGCVRCACASLSLPLLPFLSFPLFLATVSTERPARTGELSLPPFVTYIQSFWNELRRRICLDARITTFIPPSASSFPIISLPSIIPAPLKSFEFGAASLKKKKITAISMEDPYVL